MAVEPDARRRAHEWLAEVYSRLEERDALFETISRRAGQAALHRGGPRRLRSRARPRLPGRVPVHPRRLSVDVPRAALDDAPVRRLRHRRGDQRALPLPARPRPDGPLDRVRHADADGPRLRRTPARSARSGCEGVAIDTLDDMETLFDGIPLGEVTTSMTINAPAAILLAFYVAAAEEQGVPPEQLGGTIQTDILKEYIAQKEWCFPIDPAMRLVTDMIEWCTEHMPRWHPISISGLPHPRGRLDRRSRSSPSRSRTASPTSSRRSSAASTSTTSRRGCRSSSTPTSTSSRRSPSTAPRAGSGRARCATPTARSDERVVADALPHPDRGRLADRAAAAEQHRPHRDRGAGRRARRHPVAAHQLLRRGARAADRGGGADRAPHPAGDRPRDRRHQHDRPARRLLLRRDAHRRDGARRPTSTSPGSTSSAAWSRRSSRTSRSARSPTPPSATSRRSTRSSGSSSASTTTSRRTSEEIPILRIDPELERKQIGAGGGDQGAPRLGRGGADARRAAARPPPPTPT